MLGYYKKYRVFLERYQETKVIYTYNYNDYMIGDFIHINGEPWKVFAIC